MPGVNHLFDIINLVAREIRLVKWNHGFNITNGFMELLGRIEFNGFLDGILRLGIKA
jgi:hypothetical protein